MKILICLIYSSLSFSFALREYDQKPKSLIHLSQVISKYKKDKLVKVLRSFVKDTRPTRIVGSEGHYKSINFVVDYIKKNTNVDGEVVIVDEFVPDTKRAINMYENDLKDVLRAGYKKDSKKFKIWNNFTNSMVSHIKSLSGQKGKNIIWEKRGSKNPNDIIIIGAHYDTIAYDKESLKILPKSPQPGADNNGTGVSILLGLIEILSELKIEKTVRIVFFDFQEFGFLGSWDYAKKLQEEKNKGANIVGFVNLLMLGHDSKINDKEKKYGNMKVYYSPKDRPINSLEDSLAKEIIKRGKSSYSKVRFTPLETDFKNGDNVSFSSVGIPALTFTQNWESDLNERRIHTSKDFVETINFDTFYHSFKYLSHALSSWALSLDR